MKPIILRIALLAASLAALFYCLSGFTMTGTKAAAQGADLDALALHAWAWGGSSLLFLGLSVWFGARLVSLIKDAGKTG